MLTKRQRLDKRHAALKRDRQERDVTVREICAQMLPYGHVLDHRGPGRRRHQEGLESQIINSLPIEGVETLSAGLQASVTNPASIWMGMTVSDPEIAEIPRVKRHLEERRDIILRVLLATNFYPALGDTIYPQMIATGTAAMALERTGARLEVRADGLHVMPEIWFEPYLWGEYCIDVDHRGKVDTFFLERWWTVRQIVQRFGREACSPKVRTAWDRADYDLMFKVVRAVTPNDEYEKGRIGREGMRFSQCWWEADAPDRSKFLGEGGYHEFPILVPRWSVNPGDAYGRGPGDKEKADCAELQHHELELMKQVDKIGTPPMQGTDDLDDMTILPGGFTTLPKDNQNARFQPSMQVPPQSITATREHKAEIESRIRRGMLMDLVTAFISDTRAQPITAAEVHEKRREIMMRFGPVLQRLDPDLLEPCINRINRILERDGVFQDVPPELEGVTPKVEFISILHQMQRSGTRQSVQVFLGDVGALAQMKPDALDMVNTRAMVDEMAKTSGIRGDAVLSEEDVARLQQARAEQEQQAQMGEALMQAAEGAATLSKADPEKLGQMAGAVAPALGRVPGLPLRGAA